jgi:putative nucleotidyltransferase with HDIG domain
MDKSTNDDHLSSQGPPATLSELVGAVQHLPMFTGMAAQLISSVEREDVTMVEMGRLISSDPAIVMDLLRKVNSPYYGLNRKIGSATDAIAVLGLDQIRRIVSAAVLQRPLLAYLHDTDGARVLWRHQLLCAAIARRLHAAKGADGEVAYMAGLLHDVGRLVMVMHFPQFSDELLGGERDDDVNVVTWERHQFGFDHALVGAALLKAWEMPPAMMLSTAQHHNRVEPTDALAATIWTANTLGHELIDLAEDAVDEQKMEDLGLTVDVRRALLAEVAALESAG